MSEQQPQNRLAQGRAIVDFIRNLSHEHSGIRQMIDAPWEEFKNQSDSYLGHELLEPVNQPCYFLDFAEKLAAHNLTYLADAEPSISFIQGLPQQKITDLIQASQNNQVMLEQYMDFLYFRQFRKSLIIHEKAAASIQRKIPIEVFDIFDYSVDFCIEEQTQNDSPSVIASTTAHAGNTSINPNSEANTLKQHEHRFIFSHNRVVSVFNKTDYALFKGISELSPKIFNKKQLLDVINKKQSDPQLKQHLSKMLNRLSLTGYADIWHQLPSVTPTFELEEKPYMPELMRRFYKETGHLSNYRHSTISLNIVQQQLIDILDGEHDRKQMHAHLRKSLAEGFINLRDNNNQPLAEDQIDNALSAHLEQALNLLRLNALLYKKQS
jgi:methyltransferase-like protein